MTIKTTTILSLSVAALLLGLPLAKANAPAGRYEISAQTVFDTKTKLTWERMVDDTLILTADGSKERCSKLGATLGGSGWRLPTVKELYTLVDHNAPFDPMDPFGVGSVQIDPVAFPKTTPGQYWGTTSATTFMCVDFSRGTIDCNNSAPPEINSSRCVR
jgi:hypothetical protein